MLGALHEPTNVSGLSGLWNHYICIVVRILEHKLHEVIDVMGLFGYYLENFHKHSLLKSLCLRHCQTF